MKARVIATGEIVDVSPHNNHDTSNPMITWKETFGIRMFATNDIIIIPDDYKKEKVIDWEQRRFELVKTMLPQAVKLYVQANSTDEPNFPKRFDGMSVHQICSQIAVEYADAVIKKLKKD